jgi:hypothetical protein
MLQFQTRLGVKRMVKASCQKEQEEEEKNKNDFRTLTIEAFFCLYKLSISAAFLGAFLELRRANAS